MWKWFWILSVSNNLDKDQAYQNFREVLRNASIIVKARKTEVSLTAKQKQICNARLIKLFQ